MQLPALRRWSGRWSDAKPPHAPPAGILIAGVISAILTVGLWGCTGSRAHPPNIILVLVDDLGHGDLSCHGNPVFSTPFMDKLHDESVRFTDFCVSATCSPSRAALMTGMHEFKSGVTHTEGGRERLALGTMTLAELLREHGYTTGIFGKWHLGAHGPYRPEERGFEVSVTSVGDTQNSHFDPTLLHNGVPRAHKGFREDILFDEALGFIRANRGKPFFCYIPTYSPHAPLRAPEKYLERCRKKFPEAVPAAYYAMVSDVDNNLGRLLEGLRDMGLEKDTIVILMNDNGATYGVDRWNSGMRGCKGASWFGGSRALSFWRWPGHWQPRDEGRLTCHMDVLPTIADLAGIRVSEKLRGELDGVSLRPLLEQGTAKWNAERMVFQNVGRWPRGEAERHGETFCGVRWNSMLLLRAAPCDQADCKGMCRSTVPWRTMPGYTTNFAFHYALTPDQGWALYDVASDPSCEHDLAADNPATVERLRTAYREWWGKVLPIVDRADRSLDPRHRDSGGGE